MVVDWKPRVEWIESQGRNADDSKAFDEPTSDWRDQDFDNDVGHEIHLLLFLKCCSLIFRFVETMRCGVIWGRSRTMPWEFPRLKLNMVWQERCLEDQNGWFWDRRLFQGGEGQEKGVWKERGRRKRRPRGAERREGQGGKGCGRGTPGATEDELTEGGKGGGEEEQESSLPVCQHLQPQRATTGHQQSLSLRE